MTQKSKKFKFTRRLALISVAAVIVIAAGGLDFWHYHNKSKQEVITSTPSKSTTPAQSPSSNKSASGDVSSSDKQAASSNGTSSSGSQGPTDGTGKPPQTPTGNFVSNHRPGGGYPTTEQSVCTTTPGASCYIKFTNGNTTKTLTTQLTDNNGSTIWNWDANTFSSGSWQITAVATLNGQTATAADNQSLVIQ